METLFVF